MEIKFPLEFNKCPNCGSAKRLAGIIAEEEKAKGKLNEKASAFAFMQRSIIADLSKMLLSAPVLMTFYDVCADCGAVYCVHAELGTATPQARPPGGSQGMGRFGFPQGNPSLS